MAGVDDLKRHGLPADAEAPQPRRDGVPDVDGAFLLPLLAYLVALAQLAPVLRPARPRVTPLGMIAGGVRRGRLGRLRLALAGRLADWRRLRGGGERRQHQEGYGR